MMKILFAASEAVPFIKTGGLADVVGSLPKYFDKEKYDVRVMVPKYLCIRQELRDQMKFIDKFYIDFNGRFKYGTKGNFEIRIKTVAGLSFLFKKHSGDCQPLYFCNILGKCFEYG